MSKSKNVSLEGNVLLHQKQMEGKFRGEGECP